MAQESASDLMFVDDFYFSLLFDEEDEDEIFPVLDAKYAEGLQFQEGLMGDFIVFRPGKSRADNFWFLDAINAVPFFVFLFFSLLINQSSIIFF